MSIGYHISNFWTRIGIANFAFITSTNSYNSIVKNYNNQLIHKPTEPIDHVANSIMFVLNSIISVSTCTAKGVIFGLAGPIGTYRIGLSVSNRQLTGDKGWTDVICQLSGYQRTKYTTKPFGDASWLPISDKKSN